MTPSLCVKVNFITLLLYLIIPNSSILNYECCFFSRTFSTRTVLSMCNKRKNKTRGGTFRMFICLSDELDVKHTNWQKPHVQHMLPTETCGEQKRKWSSAELAKWIRKISLIDQKVLAATPSHIANANIHYFNETENPAYSFGWARRRPQTHSNQKNAPAFFVALIRLVTRFVLTTS